MLLLWLLVLEIFVYSCAICEIAEFVRYEWIYIWQNCTLTAFYTKHDCFLPCGKGNLLVLYYLMLLSFESWRIYLWLLCFSWVLVRRASSQFPWKIKGSSYDFFWNRNKMNLLNEDVGKLATVGSMCDLVGSLLLYLHLAWI